MSKGVLGYVFGTSTNLANECALVAVVPKIKYPNICYPMEDQCHIIPPARKHTKIESSLNHPHLFDPNCLLIREPKNKKHLHHWMFALSYMTVASNIFLRPDFQQYTQME